MPSAVPRRSAQTEPSAGRPTAAVDRTCASLGAGSWTRASMQDHAGRSISRIQAGHLISDQARIVAVVGAGR